MSEIENELSEPAKRYKAENVVCMNCARSLIPGWMQMPGHDGEACESCNGSVKSDTPQDPCYPALNRERGELIAESIAGTLTEGGIHRLTYLNGYTDAHIALMAPHDTSVLDALEEITGTGKSKDLLAALKECQVAFKAMEQSPAIMMRVSEEQYDTWFIKLAMDVQSAISRYEGKS
jgi:hypothetical protein